jgi:hypothetical protein
MVAMENCPSSTTMRMNDTGMNVNMYVGHVKNVNLLGQDFFLSSQLTMTIDYIERIVLISKCNYNYRGARRRRSGGGPGEGCARMPVGAYLYLHAVGVGNHVAVPSLAR